MSKDKKIVVFFGGHRFNIILKAGKDYEIGNGWNGQQTWFRAIQALVIKIGAEYIPIKFRHASGRLQGQLCRFRFDGKEIKESNRPNGNKNDDNYKWLLDKLQNQLFVIEKNVKQDILIKEARIVLNAFRYHNKRQIKSVSYHSLFKLHKPKL